MKSFEHDQLMYAQGEEAGRLSEMKNTELERKNTEKERLRADMAQRRIRELEAELKKYKWHRSRGAYLLGLTTYGKYEIEETVDFTVYVPRIDEYFAGSLAVVPLQLLGYYVSVAKGLDVDKPRNLAKSVTVE